MTDEAVSSSIQARLATGVNCLLGQLKANTRKTALLCGLVVILIVLLICTAVQPDLASATVGNLVVPQASNPNVQTPSVHAFTNPFGSEDSTGLESATEPKQTKLTLPQRDIFALDLSYFPKLSDGQDQTVNQANRINSEQAKLIALKQKVGKFRLQSTMTGAVPAACIDGTMVREGHIYKGFKIGRINNWNVLLEKDGHTFRLHIAQE